MAFPGTSPQPNQSMNSWPLKGPGPCRWTAKRCVELWLFFQAGLVQGGRAWELDNPPQPQSKARFSNIPIQGFARCWCGLLASRMGRRVEPWGNPWAASWGDPSRLCCSCLTQMANQWKSTQNLWKSMENVQKSMQINGKAIWNTWKSIENGSTVPRLYAGR